MIKRQPLGRTQILNIALTAVMVRDPQNAAISATPRLGAARPARPVAWAT